jgi:hypothetical protein
MHLRRIARPASGKTIRAQKKEKQMTKERQQVAETARTPCHVTPITALVIAGAIARFGPEFVLWLTDHRGVEA